MNSTPHPSPVAFALASSLALAAAAHAADVVINEWNCVGSQKWLGNPGSPGAGCTSPDGPGGADCATNDDTFFGRVMGNGGDWIELIVIKDHTDLRGWTLQWLEYGGGDADGTDVWVGDGSVPQGQITFTDAAVWGDLRAGTIITITEHGTAAGGLDTDLSFDPCRGDWWINACCTDAALLACVANVCDTPQTCDDLLDVGNDDWAIRILDAQGGVHVGMTGEGQPSWNASGVNSREIARLEANPTAATGPFSNYRGGDNSTFGRANYWRDAVTQCRLFEDFEPLRAAVRAELCTTCTPIALNEYNAVSSAKFLNGGTQSIDSEGGQASDSFFGRVLGNGGNWFELVVVADHLDARGWTLEWAEDGAHGVIHLSNHAFWGDLRGGMILTFIERTTTNGGLDTDLSYSPGTGDHWVNVNTHDTALVTHTTSTNPSHKSGEFTTSNDEWTLHIRDAQGNLVMEPRGEGSPHYRGTGVNSEEVCKLVEDVTGRTDSSSAYMDDAVLSTFGAPNAWKICPSGATAGQSFAGLPEAGCAYAVPGNPADLNGDGVVNGADLGLLLSSWGDCKGCAADLNGDSAVNGADLGLLLSSWG